ncbi:MAG: sugar-transfer associated ATP-grasp domain-containing protein, partial [Coriobacteriales bacterium]|nr:sugar-transfer associated ATP-grasp domain-containing protein [Coriobacteriales bacterium]
MPKLKYLMRVASGMSLDKLRQCVNDAHDRCGKPKVLLLADIVHCARKFGAGYYDYLIFEFYNMNDEERATYMTRMRNKRFDDMINDPKDCAIFDDKSQFYAHFSDYLGRDWRDLAKVTDEDLAAYLDGHEYVIAKPNDGECGHGIEKIRVADFESIDDLVSYLRQPEKNFGVVEDLLIQHPEMSRLYPHSVNCMRMATVYWEGQSHLLYAVLKTGNHGKFVDNLENGGYACHMDLETGKVTGPG